MTLRSRLTLLIGGALILALYLVFAQMTLAVAEEALVGEAGRLLAEKEFSLTRIVEPERSIGLPATYVQTLGFDGEPLARSNNLLGGAFALSPTGLAATQRGEPWTEVVPKGEKRLLVYSTPVLRGETVAGVLQVARSLADRDDALASLRTLLIGGALLTLMGAGLLGWVLAGATLRPLGRITHTAQAIGQARDFAQRLPDPASRDEVGTLATTLNGMLAELEGAHDQVAQTLQAQRRFIADASHELRTPLTTIRGYLAQVIGGSFGRIQFTPDLVPADLLGTRIYNGKTGEFITELGPVFANLLLADEIKRAPAKVQSALLEVMQERQVTIGKQTYSMPDPFLVLATQNPIESDGTYPLPEAQLDRFMFKVIVDYPGYQDELVVMERMVGPAVQLRTLLTPDHLRAMQHAVAESYIDPRVSAYAATLVQATRYPANHGLQEFAPAIAFGGSPRASINLVLGARALAFLRGRRYALPQDVADLFGDVLRHRLVLSYEGLAGGVTPEAILGAVLARYPAPRIDLGDRHVG